MLATNSIDAGGDMFDDVGASEGDAMAGMLEVPKMRDNALADD